MEKRMLWMFIAFAVGMNGLMLRLFVLMSDESYREAAAAQSTRTVTIAADRPDIVDINGVKLTGVSTKQLAIVFPQDADADGVRSAIEEGEIARFENGLAGTLPFAVELETPLAEGVSAHVIETTARHGEKSLARHLIGYLGYEGRGMTGLEAAFDTLLNENTTATLLEARVTARGALQSGTPVTVSREAERGTIRLSVDRDIQRIAEAAADSLFKKGAIAVIDLETGGVAAWVSRPNYDQNDVAAAIGENNGALLDRVRGAYNVGSVFKPVIAAAALEAGVTDFTHNCTGVIEVGQTVYTCNNEKAHGELDLTGAIACSCNTYFIALARETGDRAVWNMASALQIGKPLHLAENYAAPRGNFPSVKQLSEETELANISFGQGRLLATPLHVAAYTAAIAKDGVYTPPWVVESVLGEETDKPVGTQVFSAETAAALQAGMRAVMEAGTGAAAAPRTVSAAGKTGTAQTGSYDEAGKERVVGWFTGWFPAQEPRYAVTVMVENEGYGYESAAPVFAAIADNVWKSEKTALKRGFFPLAA